MKTIKELYHFEKFWQVYTRQSPAISKWDDRRTDMEVFINRTIAKWFSGKCFQVEIERHNKKWFNSPFAEQPTEYSVFTKYVLITNIKFAFAPYFDLITIYYVEPQSENIEKLCWGLNDFGNIKLIENEGDFRLLTKFYPIKIEKYKVPTINEQIQVVKKEKGIEIKEV